VRKESEFMKFPDDWPEGCPPEDAEPAAGQVFRLVKSNPHSAADFASHHELGTLPKGPACLRCGLSIFRTREDADHQHRAYPKLGRHVASGMLEAKHGVAKPTQGRQPTHTTWWPNEGVDRQSVFTTTEELT
jgi:hypothetical protein